MQSEAQGSSSLRLSGLLSMAALLRHYENQRRSFAAVCEAAEAEEKKQPPTSTSNSSAQSHVMRNISHSEWGSLLSAAAVQDVGRGTLSMGASASFLACEEEEQSMHEIVRDFLFVHGLSDTLRTLDEETNSGGPRFPGEYDEVLLRWNVQNACCSGRFDEAVTMVESSSLNAKLPTLLLQEAAAYQHAWAKKSDDSFRALTEGLADQILYNQDSPVDMFPNACHTVAVALTACSPEPPPQGPLTEDINIALLQAFDASRDQTRTRTVHPDASSLDVLMQWAAWQESQLDSLALYRYPRLIE